MNFNFLTITQTQKDILQMRLVMKQMYSFAKVGFLGLGNMGLPMACNLAVKGHTVYGYDVDPSKSTEAKANNIVFCQKIKDVARQAQVFVAMVPNSKHSIDICQGEGGLFENAKKDSLIIDSSTISPLVAKQLNSKAKKHGLTYVDAPVSGGVTGASAATLTFMVGAEDSEIFERSKVIIEGMGKNIYNCGKAGGGQIVKISNNLSLAIQMVGISESLAMAQRMGMDPKEVSKILGTSSARCYSVDTYSPVPDYVETSPASRNYENGFATDLMIKDLKLAIEAAQACSTKTKLGKSSLEVYEQLSKKGLGKKDFSIIFDLLKKNQM